MRPKDAGAIEQTPVRCVSPETTVDNGQHALERPGVAIDRMHRSALTVQHPRVFLFGKRDDRDVRRDLPGCERDVRVLGVRAVGEHQPGRWRAQPVVGHAAVAVATHDRDAFRRQAGCFRRIGFEHEVRDAVGAKPLHEPDGNGIVLRDDDVTGRVGGYLARRAQPHPRLQPRRIEQADEEKREHDQQKHHARQEHDDAEGPPDVAGERHVAEPESRHHDERPVEARDPRVLLAFDVQLDDVKQHRKGRHEHGEKGEVREQGAKIRALFAVRDQERHLADQEFHAGGNGREPFRTCARRSLHRGAGAAPWPGNRPNLPGWPHQSVPFLHPPSRERTPSA
jgi:hypothetical protein